MGVNPAEAEAFIAAKNIAPEEVEELAKDVAGLKATYENYKETAEAFGKAS